MGNIHTFRADQAGAVLGIWGRNQDPPRHLQLGCVYPNEYGTHVTSLVPVPDPALATTLWVHNDNAEALHQAIGHWSGLRLHRSGTQLDDDNISHIPKSMDPLPSIEPLDAVNSANVSHVSPGPIPNSMVTLSAMPKDAIAPAYISPASTAAMPMPMDTRPRTTSKDAAVLPNINSTPAVNVAERPPRKSLANTEQLGAKTMHECPVCCSKFSSKKKLEEHMTLRHAKDNKFVCTVCNQRFPRKENLRRHMSSHSGEYRCYCPECGKGFVLNNDMIKHQNAHLGEKPFKCRFCTRTFARKFRLEKHEDDTHGSISQAHWCQNCGQAFSNLTGIGTQRSKCGKQSNNKDKDEK